MSQTTIALVAHCESPRYHQDSDLPDRGFPFQVSVTDHRRTDGTVHISAEDRSDVELPIHAAIRVEQSPITHDDIPTIVVHVGELLALRLYLNGTGLALQLDNDFQVRCDSGRVNTWFVER